MKKINKKFLLILAMTIISTVMLMTLQTAAVSGEIKLDNIEYYSKDISAEKLEQIIKSMYGIPAEKPIEKGNILCIFGHSKANGKVIATEHNYYSTAPRCRETISTVEYCTRNGCDYFAVNGCDYFAVLNTSYNRIVCH